MNGQQRYKAPDRRIADPDACSTAVAVADPVPTAGPYRHNWNPEFSSEPPTDTEPAERRIVSVLASSMRMRTTQWLYEGRMPAGAISLLAGREGIGKSTIGFDIAAQLTRGELPGRYLGKPQNVGIVASEDDWECVILPRLVAARADLTRVHRVEVQVDNKLDTISAPNDLQMLRDWCAEHEIRLLIIDPIMSVIQGSLDTHKDREVRQALDPLSRFAAQTRVGILGLIHVNKSSTTDPLNSVMASRAFTAVARSVLYCVLDPEAEGEDRYLFGHPKCNVGPKQPTISYTIMQVTLEIDPAEVEDGDDAEVVTSRVKWGEQDDRSIRDALEGPPKERAKGEVNTAILAWITDQARVVARAEIAAAFPDIKGPTVDQNLSRMVRGGQLVRPFAGHYQAISASKARAA